MQAKDIMTTRVVTVPPDESISQVAAILVERNISAVPVVDADGTLRGIVSEGDLLHRAEIGTDRPAGSWWLRMFRDPRQGRRGVHQDARQVRARRHDHRRRRGR